MKTNKINELFIVLLFTMAFMMAPVSAATETVTTTLYFNVQSLMAFEVVLLGGTAVTSAPGGTPTASNIEFNSTTGTDANLQAKVTGGGATQTDGNPILSVNNVGTVNIAPLNISISSVTPACWDLHYSPIWTAICSAGTIMTNTEIQIDDSFTPAEAAKSIYLCANATACISSDETTRVFTIEGTN